MAKLEHPNIVPVHGYTKLGKHAFLIMKLIEGFSFDRILSGECGYKGTVLLHTLRNDFGYFASVARDVASALAHAHASGLVHRDIKPSNLMLDLDGKVWITDFGLAKMQDFSQSLSRTGDVIGTPRYMAPEQLRGSCDARSDIYSFGLTLYEIATGCPARESLQPAVETDSIRNELNERVDEFPETLLNVIEKASAFSPDERFQSAEELTVVLERFLHGLKPDRRKSVRRRGYVLFRNFKLKALACLILVAERSRSGFITPIARAGRARTPRRRRN